MHLPQTLQSTGSHFRYCKQGNVLEGLEPQKEGAGRERERQGWWGGVGGAKSKKR